MNKLIKKVLISVYKKDANLFDSLIVIVYNSINELYCGYSRDSKLLKLKYYLIFVKENTADSGKKSAVIEDLINKCNFFLSSNRNEKQN